jgi:hypothetical protein
MDLGVYIVKILMGLTYLCHNWVVEYPTKPSVRVAIIGIGMLIWIGVFGFPF